MIKTTYERNMMDENLPVRILLFDDTELSQLNIADEGSEVQHFVPPHWHRSIEMTYVVKGTLNLQLGESSRKVKSGEFLLVNSGVLHEVSNDPSPDIEVIVFIISYDFLKDKIANFDEIGFDIYNNRTTYSEFSRLFIEIRELYRRNETYAYLKIRAKLLEILAILMDKHQIKFDAESKDHEKIREVLEYIHANYNHDLTQHEVAEEYHVSREHFSRQFKKKIGITFTDYLINYRIYRAFTDIVMTNDAIQDVALRHGFPNTKSFITHFKRKYKMTPNAYRRSHKPSIIDHNEYENINQSK